MQNLIEMYNVKEARETKPRKLTNWTARRKEKEKYKKVHSGSPTPTKRGPTRGNRNQRAGSHQRANTQDSQGRERHKAPWGTHPLRLRHNRQKKACAKSHRHGPSSCQGQEEVPKSLDISRTERITDKESQIRKASDITTVLVSKDNKMPSNL